MARKIKTAAVSPAVAAAQAELAAQEAIWAAEDAAEAAIDAAKAKFFAFVAGRPMLEACGVENADDTFREGAVAFKSAAYWEVAYNTAEIMQDEVKG